MVLGILNGYVIWRFHYCVQVAGEYAGSCQFMHTRIQTILRIVLSVKSIALVSREEKREQIL